MSQTPEAERDEGGVEARLARHGKVSYMQIPADDAIALGEFYAKVFGWQVSGRPGHNSFSDTSGELIGAFVTSLRPGEAGILPYIYVDDVRGLAPAIVENGGTIVREPYAEEALTVATFRDPAGNVMGVWQGPK